MGMDVYGREPRSKVGQYFRANIWYWGPLSRYVVHEYPELTSACKLWDTNDGDGLDDSDSIALGTALKADVETGKIRALLDLRQIIQMNGYKVPEGVDKGLVDSVAAAGLFLPCWTCSGDGCEKCGQTGFDSEAPHFNEEVVTEFAEFLMECGGFNIY